MGLKGVKSLKGAISELRQSVNDDVRGVFIGGLTNIAGGTPAEKGTARNGWFLSEGTPSNETTLTASMGGVNSISEISKMPEDILNKTIYYTNNVPYIGVLEYGGYPNPPKKGSHIKGSQGWYYKIISENGFSAQAPGGWVRSTLALMRKKIKSL